MDRRRSLLSQEPRKENREDCRGIKAEPFDRSNILIR